MALTYSPNARFGSKLEIFTLPAVDGKTFSTASLKGPTLLMFICNHCPYVRAIEERLLDLGREYKDKAHFLAICANDPKDHPEDAPAALLARWREKNYPFPYLIDADQRIARVTGAVCTPDFFLYDAQGLLSYRGRLDDSWRKPEQVRKRELKAALDAVLDGRSPAAEQNSSMGCSIKWK